MMLGTSNYFFEQVEEVKFVLKDIPIVQDN